MNFHSACEQISSKKLQTAQKPVFALKGFLSQSKETQMFCAVRAVLI